jgi:hypothetical protein
MEHGIEMGRGGVFLMLDQEQYVKLKQTAKRPSMVHLPGF